MNKFFKKSDNFRKLELHHLIQKLKEHKINDLQADGIASSIIHMQKYCENEFVANEELEKIITHYENRIETKIAILQAELLRWFIGTSLMQTSIFIGTIIGALHFIFKE